MPTLTIDGQTVQAPEGATVLQAARLAGVEIPTLCHLQGVAPFASCMVCVVEDCRTGRLIPSCAARATEGLAIETGNARVQDTRRSALELLLSDHIGDCVGPCQRACPAQMDIPRMLRQIVDGDWQGAIATVKQDIALPAILGRICPAPCEKACRRGRADTPLAICLLKRAVADADLAAATPHVPDPAPPTGKSVAVVGAGPTGLAAAYHLRLGGHACTIFEGRAALGGAMRHAIAPDRLPPAVIDQEVATIIAMGVTCHTDWQLETSAQLDDLLARFDAVALAVGPVDSGWLTRLGLTAGRHGIHVDHGIYQTSRPQVFAAGAAIAVCRMAARAVADGKRMAAAIDAALHGHAPEPFRHRFSSSVGPVTDAEVDQLGLLAAPGNRPPQSSDAPTGLALEQARQEAARCLHCECLKPETCRLRRYADQFHARQHRYRGQERKPLDRRHRAGIVHEPGKCMDCGICVRLTRQASDRPGMAFLGRGFDMRVDVPFGDPIDEALGDLAAECAAQCPTGALSVVGLEESRNGERRIEIETDG